MEGQNNIYEVIMRRGGGKTPFILGGDFERGIAKIWLEKSMSTLVVDDFPHPKYAHVPILSPKDYSRLSTHPGIYRTIASLQHMPALIESISEKVYNTAVVFEDSYKYFPKKFGDAEIALLGNSKQKNVDIFWMDWCWGLVSPDKLRFTNYFVIGPTTDTPAVREEYLHGCYDACLTAHKEVMKKGKYQIVDSGI